LAESAQHIKSPPSFPAFVHLGKFALPWKPKTVIKLFPDVFSGHANVMQVYEIKTLMVII